MPSRNRIKQYAPESYYHIYSRGLNKRAIFRDHQDYAVFLNLLKRYLDKKPAKDKKGREYESLYGQIELLTFCLMPTHFHLLIYQYHEGAMTTLMRRVVGSYSAYYNKKYKRTGSLFQDRFKASKITADPYLQHISRYIHLNPADFKKWEFSSLPYFRGDKTAEWVKPTRIQELFIDDDYMQFIMDYKSHKKALEEIKTMLANDISKDGTWK
jgi:putative transposase